MGELLADREWDAVGAAYLRSAAPRHVVLDGFFTTAGLAAVRAGLAGGWGDQPDAFASQSAAHVEAAVAAARELRERLPEVLGQLDLAAGWAFLNQRNVVLNPHADVGVVTLNVWLTADEHNLDPATGGLVLYDAKLDPAATGQATGSPEWAERHLSGPSTPPATVIAHRVNRAVLFDASTFHASDRVAFRATSPESCRVNLSLVYV